MAVGTAGFTAALSVHALERRGLTPADGPVLVTGATGGVGSVAIGILAERGYAVAASTGKTDAEGFLKELGASEILSRDETSGAGKPLERERWAGAVDCVGASTLPYILRTLKYGAAVAASGNTGGIAWRPRCSLHPAAVSHCWASIPWRCHRQRREVWNASRPTSVHVAWTTSARARCRSPSCPLRWTTSWPVPTPDAPSSSLTHATVHRRGILLSSSCHTTSAGGQMRRTLDPTVVSREQVDEFRRDGVTIVRGLFTPDEVATIERGIEQNLADPGPLFKVASRPTTPAGSSRTSATGNASTRTARRLRDAGC